MKNSILLILIFSCLMFSSCEESTKNQGKIVETKMEFDESKEKEAIMNVIDGETSCFYKRDYDCWKKHWVNEDYAFQAWSNSDGTYDAKVGWNSVDSEIGNYIKENPIKEGELKEIDVKRKDLQIKFFNDNVAYLIWQQFNQTRDEKSYQISQETRLMEKVNDGWKIVNVTAFWDYKNLVPVDSLDI